MSAVIIKTIITLALTLLATTAIASPIYEIRIDANYSTGESVYVEGWFSHESLSYFFPGVYGENFTGALDMDCVEGMDAPCYTGMEFSPNGAPDPITTVGPSTGGWGDIVWHFENGRPVGVLAFSGFQSIVTYGSRDNAFIDSGSCNFDLVGFQCADRERSWSGYITGFDVSIKRVMEPNNLWLTAALIFGFSMLRRARGQTKLLTTNAIEAS